MKRRPTHRRIFRAAFLAAAVAAVAALAGCNSFEQVQTNRFSDEDGNFVTVTYGRLGRECETVVASPQDGREFSMKSRLAVDVQLPSGEVFRGMQCMNMLASGTMYVSSDRKWMFHANGTACSVYLVDATGRDYIHVFRGTLAGRSGPSGGGGGTR